MKTETVKPKQAHEDVTISDVLRCAGFEKVSDEQAQCIADAIRVYTEIIYNCFAEGRLAEGKPKVVALYTEQTKKVA